MYYLYRFSLSQIRIHFTRYSVYESILNWNKGMKIRGLSKVLLKSAEITSTLNCNQNQILNFRYSVSVIEVHRSSWTQIILYINSKILFLPSIMSSLILFFFPLFLSLFSLMFSCIKVFLNISSVWWNLTLIVSIHVSILFEFKKK